MNTRKLSTLNLEPFLRNTIGVDRIFENMMNRAEYANAGNYPPYNIIALSDTQYRIEIAVAGFDEEEITVTVEDGTLHVNGEHMKECGDGVEQTTPEYQYHHHGISARSFERSFALLEHVEVTGATTKNGILTIELERIVPDALKPKTIEVKRLK